MKLGIDVGSILPESSGTLVTLLGRVLRTLFTEYPDQEAVLFSPAAHAERFAGLLPHVERVVLSDNHYHADLDRQVIRCRLNVLFRSSPGEPLTVPLGRQVILIPDVRHQFFWEFCDPSEQGKRSVVFQAAIEGAGALATFSEHTRQAIYALASPRRTDVFIINPAFSSDEEWATEHDLTDEERSLLPADPFFLYPASLQPHKNHRRLLQAFARCLRRTNQPVQLVLTGDPAGWPELAAAFPHLPVRHLGYVRRPFLQVLYQRALALVHVSFDEGFGLPVLEAFRAGTAVVCAAGVLRELAGDAALFCDPGEVRSIEEALVEIARNATVRADLIRRGRERLSRYTWQPSARNLLEACRRVASSGPALTAAGRLGRKVVRQARRAFKGCWHRSTGWVRRLLRTELAVFQQYAPRHLVLPRHYHDETPPDQPPVISIVTPSYNQAEFLERTIQSVLVQRYPALEYIVQDGGSTDGTPAVLQRHADRLAHWESVADRGQSHAINLGFRHATGDIMAYLNSDDLLLPGALAYVGRYFASHPEVDVVYGNRIVIDHEDRELARLVLPAHDDVFLAWDDYIPQETMFWRRRIWERIGACMDENFHFALDWDLILRFRAAGARFVRLPRFLGAFRTHPQQKSLTRLFDFYYPEVRRLRERTHGRPVPMQDIARARGPYFRRQALCQRLYEVGLYRC
jgi:glycosyltransferase involved in cell wall biosynthesis